MSQPTEALADTIGMEENGLAVFVVHLRVFFYYLAGKQVQSVWKLH